MVKSIQNHHKKVRMMLKASSGLSYYKKINRLQEIEY